LGKEQTTLTDDKKWAKELSLKCAVEPKFLELALEELKESCGADSKTSKEIMEELTTTCHLNQKELIGFIKEVARNCPLDVKELHRQITEANGKKELAREAIYKVSGSRSQGI
jgi:hypothetical protein